MKNTAHEPLEVSLAGWLENAVCRAGDGGFNLRRQNVIEEGLNGQVSLAAPSFRLTGQASGHDGEACRDTARWR